MILGFLKHKIFDILNKNESSIVSEIKQTIDKQQIINLYNSHLLTIIKQTAEYYKNMISGFKISVQDLETQTLDFLKKDLDIRAVSIIKTLSSGYLGKELRRNLTPKYLTEFQIISSNLAIKGRIDRVKIEKEILPYEIKTREEVFESDKIQLAAYSLLLEDEFGKPIAKGIIETKNKQEEILLTPELKNRVLEIADKIREMKESSFLSNFNKCKNCEIKDSCFEL